MWKTCYNVNYGTSPQVTSLSNSEEYQGALKVRRRERERSV